MAEKFSLYISIQISHKGLLDFLDRAFVTPQIDSSWQQWWDSRQMTNKAPLELRQLGFKGSNKAFLDEWVQDKYSLTKQRYDHELETWTFLSVFFTENYLELLPFLGLFGHLASYQRPHETGFALVYDYYWNSNTVMAFVAFNKGLAHLFNFGATNEIQRHLLDEANLALGAAVEHFTNKKHN